MSDKEITPALDGLLSPHQFAALGRKIQQAATLARDLYEYASNRKIDASSASARFPESIRLYQPGLLTKGADQDRATNTFLRNSQSHKYKHEIADSHKLISNKTRYN